MGESSQSYLVTICRRAPGPAMPAGSQARAEVQEAGRAIFLWLQARLRCQAGASLPHAPQVWDTAGLTEGVSGGRALLEVAALERGQVNAVTGPGAQTSSLRVDPGALPPGVRLRASPPAAEHCYLTGLSCGTPHPQSVSLGSRGPPVHQAHGPACLPQPSGRRPLET